MKKNKTVKDTEIPKRVPLKEFYSSNPSAMRLSKAFDIKCKACGSKYVLIGIAWVGMFSEKSQMAAPYIKCMECDSESRSVVLQRTIDGLSLAPAEVQQ